MLIQLRASAEFIPHAGLPRQLTMVLTALGNMQVQNASYGMSHARQ